MPLIDLRVKIPVKKKWKDYFLRNAHLQENGIMWFPKTRMARQMVIDPPCTNSMPLVAS